MRTITGFAVGMLLTLAGAAEMRAQACPPQYQQMMAYRAMMLRQASGGRIQMPYVVNHPMHLAVIECGGD